MSVGVAAALLLLVLVQLLPDVLLRLDLDGDRAKVAGQQDQQDPDDQDCLESVSFAAR